MRNGPVPSDRNNSNLTRLGSGKRDSSAGQMLLKVMERSDGACRPRKSSGRRARPPLVSTFRYCKVGEGVRRRRQAAWISLRCRPQMVKDLVLVIWGARYLNTSRSCGKFRLASIGAELDRSRYASARSTWLDVNWKCVQRDGLDVSVERQHWQTCVATTRSRSLPRCSSTLERISGGSLLMGTHAFLIVLVARRISKRSRSASRICESRAIYQGRGRRKRSGYQTFRSPDSRKFLDGGISRAGNTGLRVAYLLEGEFGSIA